MFGLPYARNQCHIYRQYRHLDDNLLENHSHMYSNLTFSQRNLTSSNAIGGEHTSEAKLLKYLH